MPHKKIAFFPGSFKPPHEGHFDIVKKLLKNQDKIYIIISSKTRYYPNLEFNNNKRISVNKEQSKKKWEGWINKLPKKQQEKIVLVMSNLPSPILSATGMAERICVAGDTCSFVKSAKNVSNKRFEEKRVFQLKLR
jgi:cytidyltransferase-like protein